VIYASPGRRFLGFVVDFFLLGAVGVLLLPLLGVSMEDFLDGVVPRQYQVANFLIAAAYQIVFISWRGQTLGKMALRIRVVDETSAEIPRVSAAALRWLIPAAAGLVPQLGVFVLAVVYLWLLWDPRRQGIHDKVARTVVIDVLLPLAPPPPPAPEE
jgi:uncharacterized RDD family membrane protein YckC